MSKPATEPAIPGAARELLSVNPATLEELGRTPISTPNDVQQALARAKAAAPGWASARFDQRGALILKAKALLVQKQDEISRLICNETGKPPVAIPPK